MGDAMRYEHYDSLETRDPEDRERALFDRLPDLIALALRAPGWATQLTGIDPRVVNSRVELAKLPVLRKSELATRQKEMPPFAGLNATAPTRLRRLLMSPGPIFELEGKGKDFWGAARALFAAGFRSGDIVHNCYSYHLTPGAFIMESGAHALGCAVIAAGTGNTEQQLEAIAHLKPSGYLGTPDFLKILLDAAAKAGKDASSLRRGLVSGAALPASLRQELDARGVVVRQCYATADVGVIAYESGAPSSSNGMIVHPAQVAEIARRHPELGRLRLVITRTNEQDVMTLCAEFAEAQRSPAAKDTRRADDLRTLLAATMQALTKLRGEVSLVAPG